MPKQKNPERKYFEKLNLLYNNAQKQLKNLDEKTIKEFDKEQLSCFYNAIKELTLKYANDILNINNSIDYDLIKSKKITCENETLLLKADLKKQYQYILHSPILKTDSLFRIFAYFNKYNQKGLTNKEKEIIELIYLFNCDYNVCIDRLVITKRTFDDHIQRIVKKLYNCIEQEKKDFEKFKYLFPKYKKKINTDNGVKDSYCNAFTTLNDFLNNKQFI